MTSPIAVRGIDVDLAGRPVLRQVDLDVAPGEFVALLGANGSGKSTLVRATVGLVPTAAGSIQLFGTPLARFRDWRRVGYMPQRSSAVAGVPATVCEVVTSGRLARRPVVGFRTRADRVAVDEAIERIGLAHRHDSPMTELSGGQQQRVLIARALASQPDLIVMDEPTAGVDHENTEILAAVLGGLASEGTSVLLVAHELGPMRPLIDRAVVMRAGRVEHDGPVADLRTDDHEAHAHLHSSQPPQHDSLSGEGPWR